jgi:carboxymethylenebutenolidase
MPRTSVTINTSDGACPATLHTPTDQGDWPGVILYPDAGGARETFARMADQLAQLRYAVLLPDVYYRAGTWEPFNLATVFNDPDEWARLEQLMTSLTTERISQDAGAFLDFLAERPEVSDTGVGTTGYCMGGRISLIVAGHHPDRVTAAAAFHGGGLAAEDDPASPHLLADRIRASVYVAGAQDDRYFPPEQAQRLEAALRDAGVVHTVETYPALHGFAVPDNPTYDESADHRHWAALAELLACNLC